MHEEALSEQLEARAAVDRYCSVLFGIVRYSPSLSFPVLSGIVRYCSVLSATIQALHAPRVSTDGEQRTCTHTHNNARHPVRIN